MLCFLEKVFDEWFNFGILGRLKWGKYEKL